MKKDQVPTADSLPAPDAPRIKPPNYMVFVCSLDRADKAARKDPARLARFQELRAQAIAAYKAKDYATAIRLHTEAHGVAAGEVPAPAIEVAAPAAVAEVAAARSPRPPTGKGGKASSSKPAAPKAPAKPAPKQAKENAPKPAKAAKPTKGLSAMGAAAQVLAASKEPLNVKQIIAAMSEQGLWTSPGGKTPASTLAAALGRDITAKGRESRFKKADRGLFAASGRGA